MTLRARRCWAIGGGAVAILGLGVWTLLHPQTRDPYRFLDGQGVIDVSVLPPGSWPPTEVRMYSWRGSWQSAAASARAELPSFGLSERPRSKQFPDQARWLGELIDGGPCGINSDISVLIVRGRSRSLGDSASLTDDDPQWVTVLVSSFLDESWISVVRYTFFGMRD